MTILRRDASRHLCRRLRTEQLAQADLSGTPFADLTPEQRADLGNLELGQARHHGR